MRDAIIEKLNRHMSSAPKTEADVVYALVEIRKLLEQSGRHDNFSRLVFFCDWVLHPGLDRKAARAVLGELDESLRNYDAARPWEIDPDGQVHDLLSFRRFGQELQLYCGDAGIQEVWTRDHLAWREVSRIYSEIVRDCPLSMSRKDYGFNYVAKLEIDCCAPSEVIAEANPHMVHIGWNWKFTLNDGRTSICRLHRDKGAVSQPRENCAKTDFCRISGWKSSIFKALFGGHRRRSVMTW